MPEFSDKEKVIWNDSLANDGETIYEGFDIWLQNHRLNFGNSMQLVTVMIVWQIT